MKKIVMFLSALVFASPWAVAQSTNIQSLGAIPAPTVTNGLGWNLGDYQEEYVAAKAAGATHARIGSCSWGGSQTSTAENKSGVEWQSQQPNNTSGGYTLPTNCANDILYAAQNGLIPTLVGAYGAPYHQILSTTVTTQANATATTVALTLVSGNGGDTFSNVVYPYDYLEKGTSIITGKHSYAGSLITAISITDATHATVTLASALTTTLNAGTALTINEILYPSPQDGRYTTDISIQQYALYAENLGTLAYAITSPYNIPVEVELWNEPPWGSDFWDNRRDGYDNDPGFTNELQGNGQNFGFAAALQDSTHITGVTYNWGGTDKATSATLIGSKMLTYSGEVYTQPAQTNVTRESLHPYGNNPEDAAFNEPALTASPTSGSATNLLPNNGAFFGTEQATLEDRAMSGHGPTYGIHHTITETGCSQNSSTGTCPSAALKARFVMRQFLALMQDDLDYIEFYRLFDLSDGTTDPGFGWITLLQTNGQPCTNTTNCPPSTSYTALPAFTAIQGLMSDLSPISAAPVAAYTLSSLTSIPSYSGTYQLAVGHFVGSRSGATANSEMVTVWQMSATTTSNCSTSVSGSCWYTVSSPAAASVTATIPSGMSVTSIIDTITRTAVTYTVSGQSVTFPVSDNPIEIIVDPS